MDKKFADTMIAQFQKKFFGFALSKCNDMTEAEDGCEKPLPDTKKRVP